MRNATALFLAAAAALSAATPARAQAPCLRQINIWSYSALPDGRGLIVTDRSHRRYRVNFVVACPNLKFQFGLRFKTQGVSNLACVARGDQVLLNDPVGPNVCMIKSIDALAPGQAP